MPYRAKFKYLLKIMFRVRDSRAAEAVWFEGMWLNDNGEFAAAREAFEHAKMLDPGFAGAHYNYAALTEKLKGPGKEALAAWREYLAAAEKDSRQARATVEKVAQHVKKLEG